jgi:hypothetical protein
LVSFSGLPNKKSQESPPLLGSRAFLAFDIGDKNGIKIDYLPFMSNWKIRLGKCSVFVKCYFFDGLVKSPISPPLPGGD